jgi:glycosyltransferase involved in cell wall biosynthesis
VRILFVAMANSVHTARWIGQLTNEQWDIHLFPVDETPLHPMLHHVVVHALLRKRSPERDPSVCQTGLWWPFRRGAVRVGRAIERLFPHLMSGSTRLARVIQQFKPDIIHSLEIQHAGYLTLAARNQCAEIFPAWIVTNWGSDLYFFGRLSEHVDKIRAVLSGCDFYSCECQRDVELARAFGFKGAVLPVLPNSGGYHLDRVRSLRQAGPTSARRLIVLKGYQGWVGRALVGLRAIELSADSLKGYRVAVYMAGPDVKIAAALVARSTGIPIEIVPECSHEDMLQLHGRARVSIGLSMSDAISTSFLEAIIMGSFPIQSNTSCANEWVQDGKTGFIVPPEDADMVAAAIRRAVSDDAFVDHATDVNTRLAAERLDYSMIQAQAIAMYKKVAAERQVKAWTGPR